LETVVKGNGTYVDIQTSLQYDMSYRDMAHH